MSDKCPFCGAGYITYPWPMFECGQGHDLKVRSVDCCLRQISQLQEKLEAWRDMAEECARYLIDHGFSMDFIALDEQNKLKELGEI